MNPLEALDYCRKHWSSPLGLFISISFVLCLLVFIFLNVEPEKFTSWQWATLVSAAIFVTGFWWKSTRLPKAAKGTIGFAVAIRAENQEHAKKLKADFIKRLRELAAAWTTASPVCFLDLGEAPVELLLEQPLTYPGHVHEQTNCHFLIWGDAKERDIDGPMHVLELEGSVYTGPTSSETGAKISQEFQDLFPRRVHLAKERDLFTFQFTAEWIDTVAQYLIGIASYVSRDLDYAESVFLRLHKKLNMTFPSNLPQIAKIRTRLPARIAEVYKAKLNTLTLKHRLKRSPELLVESEKIMDQLDRWEPSYYGLHLGRAMCHFQLRRDVKSAFAMLQKCEQDQVEDGTWLWSKAFLEVYTANLNAAYRTYQKAFSAKVLDVTVPIQCEEFIYLILEEEPDKGQLFYALGLINLRSKLDFVSARRDLAQFLNWIERSQAQMPAQVTAARKWISEIDNELTAEPIEVQK